MSRAPRSIEFDIADRSGWVTIDKREAVLPDGQPVIYMTCEASEVPHPRYCCSSPHIVGIGRRPYTFWDEPHGLKAVEVTYLRRRFKCTNCGDTEVLEEIVDLVPGHHMTKRAFEYAVRMSTRLTFREVARHTGQSEGTLRNVFKTARKAFYAKPVRSPLALCIDEKYFISLDEHRDRRKHGLIPSKGKSVVGDLGQRRILAICDDMNWHLRAFLTTLQDRERTKVITTDMWGGYEKIHREMYAWARLVVDRFHVVKMMSDKLEAFRLTLAGQEEKATGIKRSKLRDKNGLLLSRWHKADDDTRASLGKMFAGRPLLELAYHCKEDYASVYAMAQGSNQAEDMFDSWMECLPEEVRPALGGGMFSNQWRPFVLNYFDEPYTNGFMEGMNTVIGDYLRVGRGYSLDVLRFKFIFAKIDIPMPDGLGDKAWIEQEDIEEAINAAERLRFETDQADDYQAWRDANVDEVETEEDVIGRMVSAVDWGEICAPEFRMELEDGAEVTYRIPKGFLTQNEISELLATAEGPVAAYGFDGRIEGWRPPWITEKALSVSR